MTELLDAQKELELFESRISETKIIPESNSVDKYRFISKLQIEKIDNNYIADVIKSVIKRGKVINTKEITEAGLKDIIKKYPTEDELKPLDVLTTKINARLDADFKVRNTIVEENMDVYDEVSAGFDAQMYFTLLSGEMRDKGIYIIDQPGITFHKKQSRILF